MRIINNLEELIERYSQGKRSFYDCCLENIDISGINLSYANFSRSRWINCNLIDCDFSNTDLTLADFHNSILTEVNLQNAKFDRTNFRGVDLNTSNLQNTSVKGILYDFKSKFPPGIELREAYLICAGIDLSNREFFGANLENASLCNAKLINSKFKEANLKNANLKGAILRSANLRYSELKNANLSYANLNDANLEYANLVYSNLENAILHNANLHFADIRGANLNNAKLIDANLEGVIYNNETILPTDIDLSAAYLSDKSVSNTFKSDTIVKQAKSPLVEALERINFEGIQFYPGLTREEIDEITQEIPFTFPEELYELYQWHNGMKDTNNWRNCFVSSTVFLTLQQAVKGSKGLKESFRNYDAYDFEWAWKPNWFPAFGEGTDNSYIYVLILGEEKATVLNCCPDTISASISFTSVTQMMLRKAFGQEEVDFSGANLASVDLNGFYLRNIKFTGSNFEKANLSNADLEGANLEDANLKDANLYQAKITDTNFTNAIFCNTIMPDGSIRNS
ncbi:MAG: pentapeptide repeat-containing protein [Rivularia sp. (in: cyanobacteria)]